MEPRNLISLDPQTVRKDPKLFEVYIETYYSYNGRRPSCAGCSFSSDFNRLKKRILDGEKPSYEFKQSNTEIMEQTFKIKDRAEIYTYLFPIESGRLIPARARGAYMTEEFAIAYLENASPEELEVRKLHFSILPAKFREDEVLNGIDSLLDEVTEETEEKVDLTAMSVKELKHFASNLGLEEENFKYLKKDELIKYILEQA